MPNVVAANVRSFVLRGNVGGLDTCKAVLRAPELRVHLAARKVCNSRRMPFTFSMFRVSMCSSRAWPAEIWRPLESNQPFGGALATCSRRRPCCLRRPARDWPDAIIFARALVGTRSQRAQPRLWASVDMLQAIRRESSPVSHGTHQNLNSRSPPTATSAIVANVRAKSSRHADFPRNCWAARICRCAPALHAPGVRRR